MKNIPTKSELFSFLKSGRKTIGLSIIIVISVVLLFFVYNVYSGYQEFIREEEFLSIEEIVEIVDREPEDIQAFELREVEEALAQDRYGFSFLIERDDQSFYHYPNLIEQLLIKNDVIDFIQNQTGIIMPLPAELVVDVVNDSRTNSLVLWIGTGDEELNIELAQAYFQLLLEEQYVLPILEDKQVYIIEDEPFIEEIKTWRDIVLGQVELFSFTGLVVSVVSAAIFGFGLGVFLILIKNFRQPTIPLMYGLEYEDTDTVLYFNKLSLNSSKELLDKIAHAIYSSPSTAKLLLSEDELSTKIKSTSFNKQFHNELTIAQKVEEVSVPFTFEEVIILVNQNHTSKAWYKNVRLQLKRHDIHVTIIQY